MIPPAIAPAGTCFEELAVLVLVKLKESMVEMASEMEVVEVSDVITDALLGTWILHRMNLYISYDEYLKWPDCGVWATPPITYQD